MAKLKAGKATDLDSASKRARRFKGEGDRHPVWVGVSGGRGGLSLGYRPRKDRPGTWTAKLVAQGIRREKLIGIADDVGAGPEALSYAAAVSAALAWGSEQRAAIKDEAAEVPAGPVTLGAAVEAYIRQREGRSVRWACDAQWRLTKHVLSNPTLADLPLERLSPARLVAWRNGLRGMQPATINRLLNDFRAALTANTPTKELPAPLRAALRAVPGATAARAAQVLPPAAVRAIVMAAEDIDRQFGLLVTLLAATGGRFSQVVRLQCGDVQVPQKRVLLPVSAKGCMGKQRQAIPVPLGDDVLALLAPLLRGRDASELLLVRQDGRPWTFTAQMTRQWHRAVAAAGVPAGTTPYALRSSNIVRMLGKGISVRFVAQLHDTSVAMIERHYSHFITDEIEAAARRSIEPIMTGPVATVRGQLTAVA